MLSRCRPLRAIPGERATIRLRDARPVLHVWRGDQTFSPNLLDAKNIRNSVWYTSASAMQSAKASCGLVLTIPSLLHMALRLTRGNGGGSPAKAALSFRATA